MNRTMPNIPLSIMDLAILASTQKLWRKGEILERVNELLDGEKPDVRVLNAAFSRLVDLGLIHRVDFEYSVTPRGVRCVRASAPRVNRVLSAIAFF